jgi:hypothetical protein
VVVSQISPPIRIVLVLAVAVLGAYMMFLRPKPEEIPPLDAVATPPAQVEVTPEAVDAAAGTAPATKAGEQGTAQAGTAVAPAEDLKGLPKPVRKAIRADKTLVILFSDGRSYDDKAVEKALTKVNRWDGRVYTHTAPLTRISKYGRIARGVNVEQSPTVVVADRELRAETLVGFVDRATIDQAVADARQNTTGLYVDDYKVAADKVCAQYSNRTSAIPFYYIGGPGQADRRYAEGDRVFAAYAADFKAIKAPPAHRSLHNATVADLNAFSAALHSASVAIKPGMKPEAFVAAYTRFAKTNTAIGKRMDKRFGAENMPRCGAQF